MKINFFATGGTIDKIYFDALSTYEIGNPRIKEILMEARVNFTYEVNSLIKKDSLDINDRDRNKLLNAVREEKCRRIVITHGTDTMVKTAQTLKQVRGKIIVLTGAMAPAAFKFSDAQFNLGLAVAAVQTLPPGVYLAVNGRILNPDRAVKNRERKMFEEKSE
ncbi:MAG: asparaginase domain-containing protein [Desulfobacteraceae bacterium]